MDAITRSDRQNTGTQTRKAIRAIAATEHEVAPDSENVPGGLSRRREWEEKYVGGLMTKREKSRK